MLVSPRVPLTVTRIDLAMEWSQSQLIRSRFSERPSPAVAVTSEQEVVYFGNLSEKLRVVFFRFRVRVCLAFIDSNRRLTPSPSPHFHHCSSNTCIILSNTLSSFDLSVAPLCSPPGLCSNVCIAPIVDEGFRPRIKLTLSTTQALTDLRALLKMGIQGNICSFPLSRIILRSSRPSSAPQVNPETMPHPTVRGSDPRHRRLRLASPGDSQLRRRLGAR